MSSPQPVSRSAMAVQAGSQKYYEVWRGETFTGRRFTSLVSANRYAKAIDGKVRTI